MSDPSPATWWILKNIGQKIKIKNLPYRDWFNLCDAQVLHCEEYMQRQPGYLTVQTNLLTQGKMKNGIFLSALASKPLQNVWCWNERKFNSKQMIQFWDFWLVNTLPRAGNSLVGFPSKSFIFCPKISKWAIRSKKQAIHSFAATCSRSLISSERPERIAHGRSFLVSNLSDSLTLPTKKREWANC